VSALRPLTARLGCASAIQKCTPLRGAVGVVGEIFGGWLFDFPQLMKLYCSDKEKRERYRPWEVVEAITAPIQGNPDPVEISTSYVEPQNLTTQMCMRRLARLTNGLSKKWDGDHWPHLAHSGT